jgi:surface antigen
MRHSPNSGTRRHGDRIRSLLFGSVLAASLIALACPADAARTTPKTLDRHVTTPRQTSARRSALRPIADNTPIRLHHVVFIKKVSDNTRIGRLGAGSKLTKNSKARLYASRFGGGLQCVPFARAASGIELKGNAVNWWDAASGVYQRGSNPEVGAVLNFRANGSMRLGHVAVVRDIVNQREIEIDHANWAWSGKGNVSRGVSVVDVSERNDWTAVRVALGHGDNFGSIYGTYGFIYDRPDTGTMVANVQPGRGGAPNRDVRGFDEIAETPSRISSAAYDAPARSVR